MQKRVAFYTLGCKVNASETDVLSAAFKERGYRIVGIDDESDVCVFNTCTVTGQADAQCRQAIRRAKRNSPNAVIAVVGCYAQAEPLEVGSLPGVDLVVGTRERFRVIDLVENNPCFSEQVVDTRLDHDPFVDERELPYATERTRAFLKVQDGCSYHCSYCIIPKVRGPAISRKRTDVLDRARMMRDAGFKEIVLTAVNLGEYEDGENYRFVNLLDDLCSVPGIPRIRLTSIEPNRLSEDIVTLVAGSGIICPHFHIPLQSGSDAVLRSMKRRYLTKRYASVVDSVVKHVPGASIGADIMVGFPEETDEMFDESYRFVESLPVTYLHVFKYSPRPGTAAAEMNNGGVSPETVRKRSRMLIELGGVKKKHFLDNQVGNSAEVLFETEQGDGFHYGFSPNYARVRCKSSNIANTIKFIL